MTLTEWVQENTRTLAALSLVYVGYVELTDATYPSVPSGSETAVLAAVCVAIAGYVAAGKIADLLPEDEGIYLVAFKASDETGGEVWELTEDQFADMEVKGGTLFQWPTAKRVYECREYRPEENIAVANWRESVAGSELAGDTLVTDAMEAIAEIRQEYEPAERQLRLIKRRLRGIARKQDRRRARDQNAQLDPHTNPTFGDDSASISEILQEELPEELRPESMDVDEQVRENGEGEPEDFAGFEILDEQEALQNND